MQSDVPVFSRGTFKAPFGVLTVVGSDLGIRYVMFNNDAHPKPLERLHISDTEIHESVNDAITQLDIGCDHLMCRQCGTHWCWRCRGIRNSNLSYAHKCPTNVEYSKSRDCHDYGVEEDHGYNVAKALHNLDTRKAR